MFFRSYIERWKSQKECLQDRNCLALLDWLSVAKKDRIFSLEIFHVLNLFKQDLYLFTSAIAKLARAGAIVYFGGTIQLTRPVGTKLCLRALKQLGKI